MYIYITHDSSPSDLVHRSQYEVLNTEANRTGLSIAELIRRVVEREWRSETRPRVNGYEVSPGLWRRPDAAEARRRAGIKLED